MFDMQFQRSLDEVDYLDSFQSGFRLESGNERAMLMDFGGLRKGWYNCSDSLGSLPVFSTIDYGILLDWLQGLRVRGVILE